MSDLQWLRDRITKAREPIGKLFDPRGIGGSLSNVPVTEDNAILWLSVREAEQLLTLAAALRGLQRGIASPLDPMLVGDIPCWCEPRGMFAQGPHDFACEAARTALDLGSESLPSPDLSGPSRSDPGDRVL